MPRREKILVVVHDAGAVGGQGLEFCDETIEMTVSPSTVSVAIDRKGCFTDSGMRVQSTGERIFTRKR